MIKYSVIFLLIFTAGFSFAQVQNGALKGTIQNTKGEPLAGATIVATHLPSGPVYSALSDSDGQYSLVHLKAGGAYRLKFTFVGYETLVKDNVFLAANQPVDIDVALNEDSSLLFNVNVNGHKGDIINPSNNGPSTIISLLDIQDLPVASNTYIDFARFVPQANILRGTSDATPLGISYAGESNKYNRFTIDGAKAVNAFDLYSNGTSINPIPLQSVQGMQVLLSPYDVTHGRFLGGDINITTRGGTNTLKGAAYSHFQDQNLVDKNAPKGTNRVFGADIGGPLIRNKLFFFTNIENTAYLAGINYNPVQAGSGSKFDPVVLQGLADYLKNKYNFDPGSYSAINRTVSSTSVFGRIDWIIDEKNKLTLRNSYTSGENFVVGRSPATLTFNNAAYTINTNTNSAFLELKSAISFRSENLLRLSYNYINNAQNTAEFPSVTINDGGLIYDLGGANTAAANSSSQKDFGITDNYTFSMGPHAFTFGSDNEFLTLRSIYLPGFNGYYSYNSIAAFEAAATPVSYSVGYSTKGGADEAPALMRAGQLSAYGQDVWPVASHLLITYGFRVDLPVFLNKPADNQPFNTSSVARAYGVATNKTPRLRPEISPRAGFNYDLYGDQTTQLRGGAGIFTSDIPYFWISNQYTNTGVNSIRFAGVPKGLTFHYQPNQPHLGAYIPANSAAAPTEIDVTDPDFKLPQQLHANLAIDRVLPDSFVGTFEVLYFKTISDILYRNLNLGAPEGTVTIGSTNRPYYNFKYLNTGYTDVVELTNTSKGYGYDFTARLKRLFAHGWSVMAAYTLGHSYSVNDGTGPTAIGNWRTAYTVNGLNYPDESNSNFDLGSRIISYFYKTYKYHNNRWSTTVSLIYSGQTGVRYSYLYNYNINGDGISNRYSATDLAYIPMDANQFVSFNRDVNGVTSVVTPVQQLTDLKDFIADNQELQKYEGKSTSRNGFTLPWENHVDLSVNEGLSAAKSSQLHFGITFANVANLLDKNWGRAYSIASREYSLFNVVRASPNPQFTFDKTKLNSIDGHLRAYAIDPYNSEWRAQLQLNYTF